MHVSLQSGWAKFLKPRRCTRQVNLDELESVHQKVQMLEQVSVDLTQLREQHEHTLHKLVQTERQVVPALCLFSPSPHTQVNRLL